MAVNKPALAKGTRDFGPDEMHVRNFVFDTLKKIFNQFAFQPIETPAMEQLATLTGKYGDEGDKLIFKILNSGDFMANVPDALVLNGKAEHKKITPFIAEKALRYDLTVPLARYVVMNQNNLITPFKRYQIQPVWRADRPQKGRYREFYQCDCDVIGSSSLLHEVELTQIYVQAFKALNLPEITVLVNNRKVLMAIAEACAGNENALKFIITLDKKGKIDNEQLKQQLLDLSIEPLLTNTFWELMQAEMAPSALIKAIQEQLPQTQNLQQGLYELTWYFDKVLQLDTTAPHVKFDLSLARGLDYYTGLIFEVITSAVPMGSLGGGGRYDNLTANFGVNGLTGVGISFGAERIIDVLTQLNRIPAGSAHATQLLFTWMDDTGFNYAFNALQAVRNHGIKAELYPDAVKMRKMMTYADQKNITWVAVCGPDEVQQNKFSLKNMNNGQQVTVNLAELLAAIA